MYARIVFVCANKLEVSKKRVAHLAFSDIVQCAGVMMALWTPVGAAPGVQLDPVFLQELRDLKFLLNNDRDVLAEHRALVAAELAAHGDTFKTLHAHFKGVARACLAIGAGLSQPKEFRDVFVDVVDKVVDPLRALDWTLIEIDYFFPALFRSFDSIQSLSKQHRMRFSPVYTRLVRGIHHCVQRLYKP
eukprot:Opistho-2@69924